MRHDRILTFILLGLIGITLTHAAESNSAAPGSAEAEWEFLREAAKEVELYLPNEAIVNEGSAKNEKSEGDFVVDEVSTGQAAPVRKNGTPTLRQRGHAPLEVAPTPEATPAGNSRSPALPWRRLRSR